MATVEKHLSIKSNKYLKRQSAIKNSIAVVYTFVAYFNSIYLLTLESLAINIVGILLLSHSLVYSAYLCHECMHGTIFKGRRGNTVFGTAMLWLNGGCYYGFKPLMLQHIAHHVDRVDVFTFDIPNAIKEQKPLILRGILVLEWLYFPIVAFLVRWRWVVNSWLNANSYKDRARLSFIFITRTFLWIGIGWLSWKALLFYFISYINMIHVLRFFDAFQHTYEAFPPGEKLPRRDAEHEQKNTFSNLVSTRYPLLNVLFLNFGYHNAHHAVMKCPWHILPDLDRDLTSTRKDNYIPLSAQVLNYHRFRITRLLEGQGKTALESKSEPYEQFYGAVDVSFLTLY